jgi:aminopeptidase N
MPVRCAPLFVLALVAGSLDAQSATATRPFHVSDYDLTLDLPERGKMIEGTAVLTVVRLGRADTLVLDLNELRVSRVLVNGAAAGFSRTATQLRIAAPGGKTGDTLTVSVSYSGAPKDGLIISTDSAGRWIAFGDNWPDRGRNWIPSIDHPSDKATVTWNVRAPSALRVVGNGHLLEESPLPLPRDPDGSAGRAMPRTLTRWRESRPIPVYLMVIAAAPLAKYDLGPTACGLTEIGGCVYQSVYVAPEQRGILPGEFARADDIVSFYAQTVSPFPYEKLAHLQSSTRFGGMENASAIFYADKIFRAKGVSSELIAHETAHQWFGNAVTEREWSHAWLSEGFATYFAALWARHAFGDTSLVREMARTRVQLLKSDVVAKRPVIDTLQTDLMAMLNENSYQKGGWVLHMLRTTVGDSAFFRGIRDYHNVHRHGTALSDDLMHAVEKRHGAPLQTFFDQWLRRPGYAQVTTSWKFDAATRKVVLEVEQSDKFGFYAFPLAVDIVDADGTTHRQTVNVQAYARARFTLPHMLSAAPSRVIIDPDVQLLAEFRTK